MTVPHWEQVGRPASDLGMFPLIPPLAAGRFRKRGRDLVGLRFHLGPFHCLAVIWQSDNHFVVANGNDHVAVSTVGILTDPYLFPTLGLPHGWRPSPREGVHELCDGLAANATRFAGAAEALERGLAGSEGQALRKVPALPTSDAGTVDVPRQPMPPGA